MQSFAPYDGLKMATMTCLRTIDGIDGAEVTNKLMWSITALYQATLYAMLLDQTTWPIIRKDKPEETNTLVFVIKSCASFQDVLFIRQYNNGEEEKEKIDHIETIRHIVMHGNTHPLSEWAENIAKLKDFARICARMLFEIVDKNFKLNSTSGNKRIKEFVEHFVGQLHSRLSPIPNS